MGKRGIMKGRPGLLFIVFVCICLLVFFFSWQKLMSPRFDQKSKQSAIHESGSVPRSSNVESWKFRQQFEDLQQSKQLPHRLKQNQVKMPHNEEDGFVDMKSSNAKESDLFDRYDNSRRWSAVDKSETAFGNKNEMGSKIKPVFSTPVLQRALHIDENNFFIDPIESIQRYMGSMERLVHLDLKGAVPNLKYFEEIIPLFKKLGATGLLVEYEDMFPFSGVLEPLKSGNAFTLEQLDVFLQTAKKHNLKVMPLVQTFGHMEFVLKSAFPELRESSFTPQVIDMTNNSSYKVIAAIIQQVLDAHPDATHLHIGCDEVYELGRGASASVMQEKQLTVHQMFLQHAKRVAQMVSSYKAHKVVPVMWDDMLRKTPERDIARASLPSEVEIMVWHYTPNVTGLVGKHNFEKYSKFFKSIWIASSFKGATGSRQFYTEPLYHFKNHISWLEVIEQHHKSLSFKGVALTGWQRFDHFATLCELIPVAVPSLAVCLATIKNAGFTKEIYESTSEILKCDNNIPMTFPEIDNKTKLAIVTQDCSFPGSDIFYAMQAFYGYTKIPIEHRLEGWLSDYQVSHGFTNPGQLKVLAMGLNKKNNGYTRLTEPLKLHLSSIYSPDVVEEWLEENIYERKRHNAEILDKVNNLLKITVWPKRPLPSIKQEKLDTPQQSKKNSSSSGVEPRALKDPRMDTRGNLGRSEQVRHRVNTRGRYSVDGYNIDTTAQKESNIARSKLGIKNQQFGSETKENRAMSQRIGSESGIPAQVGSKGGMNRDNVRPRLSVDPLKHNYLEGKARQNPWVDEKANDYHRSETDRFKSLDEIKEDRVRINNKHINTQKKLRPLENQRSEEVLNRRGVPLNQGGVAQKLHHQMQFRNDISPAETDKLKMQSFSQKRQPILGKSDLSDFHDEEMERYENKLINNKI